MQGNMRPDIAGGGEGLVTIGAAISVPDGHLTAHGLGGHHDRVQQDDGAQAKGVLKHGRGTDQSGSMVCFRVHYSRTTCAL